MNPRRPFRSNFTQNDRDIQHLALARKLDKTIPGTEAALNKEPRDASKRAAPGENTTRLAHDTHHDTLSGDYQLKSRATGTDRAYLRSSNATITDPNELGKFDVAAGLHEWLPTNMVGKVVNATDARWRYMFITMRCPTWLPVMNPLANFPNASNKQKIAIGDNGREYQKLINEAIQLAKNPGSTGRIKASSLGLFGHSGGLSDMGIKNGKGQRNKFMATWHLELEDILKKHIANNDFDGWATDLDALIRKNFMFVEGAFHLPGVTKSDSVDPMRVMEKIDWDLDVAGTNGEGNPHWLGNSGNLTLADISVFYGNAWAEHLRFLDNTFRAGQTLYPSSADANSASGAGVKRMLDNIDDAGTGVSKRARTDDDGEASLDP